MKHLRKLSIFFVFLWAIRLLPLPAMALGAPSEEADQGLEIAFDAGLDATGGLIPTDALTLDASSIFLYERRTDTLIYAKDPDSRRYPASLTKLMTCLLAMEYGSPYDTVLVTASALAGMDPNGSSAELQAGESYTLEQLLYCLMVKSANDAALVIAEYIGGDQETFVQMMNDRAAELGCTGTHFVNPHGMHDEDHYSTARDLARIAQADLEYDLFRSLYSTDSYTLPATDDREERVLHSTNYLISTDMTSKYYDPRVIGGKTGFTTPAGRCVICTANDDVCSYLAVVLGASSTDENGQEYFGGFPVASALFDQCLWTYGAAEIYLPGDLFALPVKDGAKEAELTAYDAVYGLLPLDYNPELIRLTPRLLDGITAPLEADVEAGELLVSYQNVCVGRVPLYTVSPVEAVVIPIGKRNLPAGRVLSPLPDPWNRIPLRC